MGKPGNGSEIYQEPNSAGCPEALQADTGLAIAKQGNLDLSLMTVYTVAVMRWWIVVAAMLMLALAAGLYWSVCQKYLLTADAINIGLVAGLVLVTAYYAWEASQSRKAMEEQTRNLHRPIIVLGRSHGTLEVLDADIDKRLVIEQAKIDGRCPTCNVGPGPALNVKCFLRVPNRKNPERPTEARSIMTVGLGEIWHVDLRDKFREIKGNSLDLTLEYQDVFGQKWCSGLVLEREGPEDDFTVKELFYEKAG